MPLLHYCLYLSRSVKELRTLWFQQDEGDTPTFLQVNVYSSDAAIIRANLNEGPLYELWQKTLQVKHMML